ncbi:MAG: tRNA (adenosine(37)-N6)-dimethylallyltransferase MiaA [Actinomycetota bacterium]|nr:tRNA (adenosine(37)-N6)-dimethylallyltransferase MiaA [Actinomycetota bacterium]
MNKVSNSPKLVIVGTTAAGKSSVAMEVARSVKNIEIISVDSMQIYRGMDIGTAKPTRDELAEIPHHMIDIVDPEDEYTISQFQNQAEQVLKDIDQRSSYPLLVGGTGLYLRSILDKLTIPSQYPKVLKEISKESDTAKLHKHLDELDPLAASRMEKNNRRRILRALEVSIGSGKPFSSFGPGLDKYPKTDFKVFGLRWSREAINERITQRYKDQLEEGFLDEVEKLFNSGKAVSRTAAQALGYKHFYKYLKGEVGFDDALNQAITDTRKFARKQERWFRRDPRICWVDIVGNPLEAVPVLMKEYE